MNQSYDSVMAFKSLAGLMLAQEKRRVRRLVDTCDCRDAHMGSVWDSPRKLRKSGEPVNGTEAYKMALILKAGSVLLLALAMRIFFTDTSLTGETS